MYAYKRLIRTYSTANNYYYRLFTILVQAPAGPGPGPGAGAAVPAPAPVKFRPRHISSIYIYNIYIRNSGCLLYSRMSKFFPSEYGTFHDWVLTNYVQKCRNSTSPRAKTTHSLWHI